MSKVKAESDYDKIEVTPHGDFFMSSKNIFNDKKESLDLIAKLRPVIDSYQKKINK